MTTARSGMEGTINPLDYGFIPGPGITTIQRNANATLLQSLATNYTKIKFPAGFFEWNGTVTLNGVEDCEIAGEGPATRIYNGLTGAVARQTFRIENCSRISIRDMQIEGSERTAAVDEERNDINGIRMIRSNNCRLEGLYVMGHAGRGIAFYGCKQLTINGNKCWANEGKVPVTSIPTATNSTYGGDIYGDEDTGVFNTQVIITNNQCLSNAHQGICNLAWSTNCVVSNNIVVAFQGRDLTTEADTEGTNNRKEAITLNYKTEAFAPNSNQHQFTCTGNTIRNARWSGIYCNSNAAGNNNQGGIRGTITGNVIDNVCLDGRTNQGLSLTNGITIAQLRQVTVTGNTISRVFASFPGDNTPRSAIQVSATAPATDSHPTAAVISSNHIQDIRGHGVKVRGDMSGLVVNSNIIQDVEGRCISILPTGASGNGSPKFGELEMVGNDCTTNKATDALCDFYVRVESSAGEPKIIGNKFAVTNGTWGQAGDVYMMYVTNPTTERLEVKDNTFFVTTDGPGTKTNRRGFRVLDLDSAVMHNGIRVSGNHFLNFNTAFWTSGSGACTILENDNRFTNCNTETFNTNPTRIFTGETSYRENKSINFYPGTPDDMTTVPDNAATFQENDQARNVRYKPGRPTGWYHDGSNWVSEGGDYVNSMQFNVPRDGTTNASPALQAMLDYASSNKFAGVRVMPGKYLIGTGLTLHNPTNGGAEENRRFLIRGEGAVLEVASGVTAFTRSTGGDWTTGTGGTNWNAWKPMIDGFCFRGADNSASGIVLEKTNAAMVVGCDFENMDKAVEFVGSFYCAMINCNAMNCQNAYRIIGSSLADGTTDINANVCYATGCRTSMSSATDTGFFIHKAANVTLMNCVTEGSACAIAIHIDNVTEQGGAADPKARRHVSILNHWNEVPPTGPVIQFVGDRTVLEVSGMHVSDGAATRPENGILYLQDTGVADFESTNNLVKFTNCESLNRALHTRPWFGNQVGNATPQTGRNVWIFEDNIINGLASGQSLQDTDEFWEGTSLRPLKIEERTYDTSQNVLVKKP